MMTRYDPKLVSKIIKETYKRAMNIQIDSQGGSDDAGSLFGNNAMLKWANKLETIQHRDGFENISRQILYLDVLSMMCRDDHSNGLYEYQV